MGKTSNAVKDRWNSKTYDDLRIRVPKGRRKDVEELARMRGTTVNGLVGSLLQRELQFTDEEWKHPIPQEPEGSSSDAGE